MPMNTQQITETPSPQPRTPVRKARSVNKKTATQNARKRTASVKKLTEQQRHDMISVAAYYIAEKNGFQSNPDDDWLLAESQFSD